MFRKSLIFSTLALSSFLFASTSFAVKPTNIPCPCKKLIHDSAEKVDFTTMQNPKTKEFFVTTKSNAFESDGHGWLLMTIIHADNKEDAITQGRKNLRQAYNKFNTYAEEKDGHYMACMYFGNKGIIIAVTPKDGSSNSK